MPQRLQRRQQASRGPAHQHRGSARQRGYTRLYEAAREVVLAEYPLCRVCESRGIVRAAEETHHVTPVSKDKTMAADANNLLSVCTACHDVVEGLTWGQLAARYGIGRPGGG